MATKKVMAVVIEDDGQGYPRLLTAIEYEARWWLIGSSLSAPGAEPTPLALLIPLDAFETLPVSDPGHQLLLGWSVYRSELDGRRAPGKAGLNDVRWLEGQSPSDLLQ